MRKFWRRSKEHKNRLEKKEKYIIILEKKINNTNVSICIKLNDKFYDPIKIPAIFFSGTWQANLKGHKEKQIIKNRQKNYERKIMKRY